jgi:hypothetical protein
MSSCSFITLRLLLAALLLLRRLPMSSNDCAPCCTLGPHATLPSLSLAERETTMFNLQNITRKNIWSLTPYRCARDDYNTGILLDANENTHGSAITNSQDLNRYPDPHLSAFKSSFSQFRGLEHIGLFVGVGSDECIDLLLRCFCVPGVDEIVICPPTYGMYTVSAQTNDVGVIRANLNSKFQLDIPLVSSHPLIPCTLPSWSTACSRAGRVHLYCLVLHSSQIQSVRIHSVRNH